MKPVQFTFHPISALAGAVFLALCLVTLGALAPQGSSSDRDINAVEIVNGPVPAEPVRVSGTTAFTVPQGKRFILTGMACSGSTGNSSGTIISKFADYRENGSLVFSCNLAETRLENAGGGLRRPALSNGVGFVSIPQGVIAEAGTVVSTNSIGVLFGYLLDI